MKASVILGVSTALLVVVAAVLGFPYLLHRALASRNGPEHRFVLPDRPAFLSEELALQKARSALALDGYPETAWQPSPDTRTVAPDGRSDAFLARNKENPKDGFLMFTNAAGVQQFVHIELEGTNLLCQRVYMK